MAEWVDSSREWTDLLAPEWEGDLSVSTEAALTMGITGPNDVVVRVDCSVSLSSEFLTIGTVLKDATVRADTNVTVGGALALTASGPKDAALTIASAAIMGSAIAAALTVPAHVGSPATIIYPIKISITTNQKSVGLTITSDVPVAAVIGLTATALEPAHVGVISNVPVDAIEALTLTLLATDLTIDPVFVTPDCFSLALAQPAATPLVSSTISIRTPLTAAMTWHAATVRSDCTPAVAVIPLVMTVNGYALSQSHVVPAALALTATLKEPDLTFNRNVALSAIPALALAVKAPEIYRSGTVSPDAITLSLAVQAPDVACDYLYSCGALIGTIIFTLNEPESIEWTASVVVAPVALSLGAQEAVIVVDCAHALDGPAGELVVTFMAPEYFGPSMPEVLILNSYITLEKEIESDLDIRMSAYG